MRFLFLFLFPSFTLFGQLSEENWLLRMRSFLVLEDLDTALLESKNALEEHPSSRKIQEERIRLLAKSGDINGAMTLFRKYQQEPFFQKWPRDLIEDISWAVIEQGAKSDAPETKAISVIAAAIGNDYRGVEILANKLSDSNRMIRYLTADIASHFRDKKLLDIVYERLQKEPDLIVKEQLILASGRMKIIKAEPLLLGILGNIDSSREAKLAAVDALVALKEKVDPAEIIRFSKDSKSAFRSLAAELVRYNGVEEDKEILLPLLKDSSKDVRESALLALASLRVTEINGISIEEYLTPLHSDPFYQVALSSALVLTLKSPQQGQEKFLKSFKSDDKEERVYATSALMASGRYGLPLGLQVFKESDDVYVKMNLALLLIRERVGEELAAAFLLNTALNLEDKLEMRQVGPSKMILKSEGRLRVDIPNYPEAMNQMSRLEILNELAMLGVEGALPAVRKFLTERSFGITGAASVLLLSEGDDETIDLIKELLNDPSERIRLQASLVLASFGKDKAALKTLIELYPKVSRNQKEQILEAVGQIGDMEAIPFLLDSLIDSHQKKRMIAALSLLLILYH